MEKRSGVLTARVKKFSSFDSFKEFVAKEMAIPEERQLWLRWTSIDIDPADPRSRSYTPAKILGQDFDETAMCLI